ncbi:MAG: cyanoexosortase A system-associated protein [Microcystaceae cyanobacterium]
MSFSPPSAPTENEAIAAKPVKSWDFWRWLILISLSGSAALVLLKVAFFPTIFKATPLNFPPELELSGWEQKKNISNKLPPAVQASADKDFSFVNGKVYQYRQGDQVMTVELRYFNPIAADVKAFLSYYRDAKIPALTIKEQPGLGSYALFTTQGRSHLSTCLNASGGSTVDREQFTKNRYRQDLRPDRLFLWVIGQSSLLDSRCLWVDMAIVNENPENPDVSYKTLQQAWQNWSQWWQPYFAKQQV